MRRGPLFIFLFFPFHFSKTTEICFGSTKMGIPGKCISPWEKKIRKNDFAPSEKYSSYTPGPVLFGTGRLSNPLRVVEFGGPDLHFCGAQSALELLELPLHVTLFEEGDLLSSPCLFPFL